MANGTGNFATRHPLAVTAAAGAGALAACTAYARRYKLTQAERDYPVIGDRYFEDRGDPVFDGGGCAIEIDAPAEVLWWHIKQMGTGQAGWYSFEKLERLFTFDIRNHYTIHPEWQDRKVGDFLFYHQAPWGVGSDVVEMDEEKRQLLSVSDSRVDPAVEGSVHLNLPGLDYFAWTWNFAAVELGPNRCKYLTKCKTSFSPMNPATKAYVAGSMGFVSYFMLSHQCNLLKRICEGRKHIDAEHI